MLGDPEQTVQPEFRGEEIILLSTPGFYNYQGQSFEEARLRPYELTPS